jgi:putative transposase
MDWKQLLGSITRSVDQELRLRNAYLATENRILRNQIKGRVQLNDGDRQVLAESGRKLGQQALEEVATIAKPETILAWHRKFVTQKGDGSKARKVLGRPRVDQEVEALVVRMARENRSWGYDRIVGALHNLGYRVSDQTVGNILKRYGIPPAPERKKTTTWQEFIRLHMDVLVVTNFFTSEVWTWGRLVIFVLLSLLSFGRYSLHLVGITAWLHALRRGPLPSQPSVWRIAVARWIQAVMEHEVPRVLQCGEHGRRPALSACATHASQKHFPHSRGPVVLLPVVSHCQRRDGPLRRQQRLGGLLMDTNREAA